LPVNRALCRRFQCGSQTVDARRAAGGFYFDAREQPVPGARPGVVVARLPEILGVRQAPGQYLLEQARRTSRLLVGGGGRDGFHGNRRSV